MILVNEHVRCYTKKQFWWKTFLQGCHMQSYILFRLHFILKAWLYIFMKWCLWETWTHFLCQAPWQFPKLQSLVWVGSGTTGTQLCALAGWQYSALICCPCPHVVLHGDQADHSDPYTASQMGVTGNCKSM